MNIPFFPFEQMGDVVFRITKCVFYPSIEILQCMNYLHCSFLV